MSLAGTTWLLNAQPDTSARITPLITNGDLFISNGLYYNKLDIQNSKILYGRNTDEIVYDTSGASSFTGWRSDAYRIIAFVDEPESDKEIFETWLSNNASPYVPSESNYVVSGDSLSDIADAIRTKTGDSSELVFPSGFISAIDGITTLGEGTQDANATSDKICLGYSAYVKGEKIAGTYSPKVSNVLLNQSRNGGGLLPAGFHKQGSLLFTFKKPNLEYWSSSSLNARLNVSTYSSYIDLQVSFESGEDPKIKGYANQDFSPTYSSYIGLSYNAQAVVSLA